jgi:hypothetical protein
MHHTREGIGHGHRPAEQVEDEQRVWEWGKRAREGAEERGGGGVEQRLN